MRLVMVTHLGPRRSILDRLTDYRTPREMGFITRDLQRAQALNLDANATQCMGCALRAQVLHGRALTALPRRYRRNKDWWHRHVVMPGARMAARLQDEREADR